MSYYFWSTYLEILDISASIYSEQFVFVRRWPRHKLLFSGFDCFRQIFLVFDLSYRSLVPKNKIPSSSNYSEAELWAHEIAILDKKYIYIFKM